MKNGLALFVFALALACAGTSRAATPAAQAELDTIIKAAKAEGEVTFYIAMTENVGRWVVDGFTGKYGIKAQFIRLSTLPLTQRYMAEAESGNIACDVVIIAGAPTAYVEVGIPKGWVEPISKSALPVMTSGEYPAKLTDGVTAIIQVVPWAIGFNTQKVKGDAPKGWNDLLNPKWKGEVLVADPGVGTAYAEFWIFIHDKFGDAFFKQLAPNLRRYASGPPAIQALSAGEGSVQVPVLLAQVQGPKAQGAPLSAFVPDSTTGLEGRIVMTARAKAKHPNAARLLANYLLSPDGNKAFNSEPGGLTIYDTTGLPKQYESPKPNAAPRVKEMATKLGF